MTSASVDLYTFASPADPDEVYRHNLTGHARQLKLAESFKESMEFLGGKVTINPETPETVLVTDASPDALQYVAGLSYVARVRNAPAP